MINIKINGVDYNLPIEKLNLLLEWLKVNGGTKVLENNTPDITGRSLINE